MKGEERTFSSLRIGKMRKSLRRGRQNKGRTKTAGLFHLRQASKYYLKEGELGDEVVRNQNA